MNREIRFRGLRTDGKGWVYGDLLCNWTIHQILSEDDGNEYKVIPESVGQFTGLHDKNGVEIYEGDVVRILYTDWTSKSDNDSRTLEQYLIDISKKGSVVFKDNGWYLEFYSEKFNEAFLGSIDHGKYGFIEIIGSIHTNEKGQEG